MTDSIEAETAVFLRIEKAFIDAIAAGDRREIVEAVDDMMVMWCNSPNESIRDRIAATWQRDPKTVVRAS